MKINKQTKKNKTKQKKRVSTECMQHAKCHGHVSFQSELWSNACAQLKPGFIFHSTVKHIVK